MWGLVLWFLVLGVSERPQRLRVQGLGFRVLGLGFWAGGLRAQHLGF